MAWSTRIILGLAAALAAGSALACDRGPPCARYDAGDRYGPPAHRGDVQVYRDPYGWRAPAPACADGCGEITLPSSFFAGGGGVGPIPSGPIYGGYVVVYGARSGAYAAASASAYASASARASVRISGGRSGGCCH